MEALIINLVISAIQSIPSIISAVNASKTLSKEEKDKLLFELNVHLTEAKVKVAAVRFKPL